MIKIEYPAYKPKIKKHALPSGQAGIQELIFDGIRKKWVALTPEEWVRQNFLNYLIRVKKYPASLIAVEKEIKLGDLIKRFDIVVYNKNSKPWMIIECKEMNVPLDTSVLDQVLRYNITLQVPYLVITNGNYCRALSFEKHTMIEIDEMPVL